MADVTFEQILQSKDAVREWVDVPEWGGEGAGVFIRSLSVSEQEQIEYSFVKNGKFDKDAVGVVKAYKIACAMVNSAGERIVPNDGVSTRKFSLKRGAIFERLQKVYDRLNGVTEEAVKDAEKNSEPTQ